MKHFYLKACIALAVIVLTVTAAFQLVYPDSENTNDTKSQEQLIQTLSDKNVYISSSLLDFRDYEIFDTTMENAFNIASLSKQYLGNHAVRYDDSTYRSGLGTLTFKNYHMVYTPSYPLYAKDTADITMSNAGTVAGRLCAEYGIPFSDAQIGVSGTKDKISVSVMYRIDSLPVFNNALVLELSKNGLHSISGTYYKATNIRENVRYAKNMKTALLEFANECTYKTRETVITDIQLGYLMNSTEVPSTAASPVWRIIVDDTAIYYVNA